MDEIEKLHGTLLKEGKYTKSLDEFKTTWNKDSSYRDKVYDVVSRDGLYTKDKSSFFEKYSVTDVDLPPMNKNISEVSQVKEPRGVILNTIAAIDRGFYKNAIGNPVKGIGTLLEGITKKIAGGDGKSTFTDSLIKFGNYFNKTIDELAPQDEDFKGTLVDQFADAFGQVASLIATAGIGGAISKGATAAEIAAETATSIAGRGGALKAVLKPIAKDLTSPVAISAGLSMGQSEFDRAKNSGATDDQAFESFYKNAAVGSVLEKIPVMQFMKRFNNATAGGITSYLKSKAGAGIAGGIEEMTTEVLQQLYANKTAEEIYNTNQDIFEGIGSSGGIGFGVGFLLNAMGANSKILKKQNNKEASNIVMDQIDEFKSELQNEAPSSYKLNGIKINDSNIIKDLINNTDPLELTKANIEITNDHILKEELQNKIITSSIKSQVKIANPELNEASLDAITELEKELEKLERNKTQTGKDKASSLRQQIKNIQENQIQEETAKDVIALEENKLIKDPEVTGDKGENLFNKLISSDNKEIEGISKSIDYINNNSDDIESVEPKSEEILREFKKLIKSGLIVEVDNKNGSLDIKEIEGNLKNNNLIKITSKEPDIDLNDKEKYLFTSSGIKDVNGKVLTVGDVFNVVNDIKKLKDENLINNDKIKADFEIFKAKEQASKEPDSIFRKYFEGINKGGQLLGDEKEYVLNKVKYLLEEEGGAESTLIKIKKKVSDEVTNIVRKGDISLFHAKEIIEEIKKIDLSNENSLNNFMNYYTHAILEDKKRDSKLSEINKLNKEIALLSKDKKKDINLTSLAGELKKIDASLLKDTDAYKDVALKLKESLKGSSINKSVESLKLVNPINIEDAKIYISKILNDQAIETKKEKTEKIKMFIEEGTELNYDEMMNMLEDKNKTTKHNEYLIRKTLKNLFKTYSDQVKEGINIKENLNLSQYKKNILKKFMDIDLNLLNVKESIKAIDALLNFLENNSIARIDNIVSGYTSLINSNKLVKEGIKARELKSFRSKGAGRFFAEQIETLPILFEKLFPGVNKAIYVMKNTGLTNLISKASYAKTKANNIVNDYVNKFYKKTANKENFNSLYNNIERGALAKLIRNVIGSESQMNDEFLRRKGLVKESINILKEGDSYEKKLSDLYEKAFNKIIIDSSNIKDVKEKADPVNLNAVEFWVDVWDKNFQDFSDISEGVYNIKLDKDLNYTPDKFSLLTSHNKEIELNNDESLFHKNSGELYNKESGVLMKVTNPTREDINKAKKYLNLSFDKNMSNSMYEALIDINTASAIKEVDAFLNSDNLKKIFSSQDDIDLIKGTDSRVGRLQLYVNNLRNKNHFTDDELSSVMKKLDKLTTIGVGMALGKITQPLQQSVPVALNTFINTGSFPKMKAIFNKDVSNFISNSGESIANRDAQAQLETDSINKLIKEESASTVGKTLDFIAKSHERLIKYLLVNWDVAVARGSWITYYEQSLKKQGVKVSQIDYSKHIKNEKAANYATKQVDRQQKTSDHDLSGKLFSSKEAHIKIFTKTALAFASFSMNQSSRLGSDLVALRDKTSTDEDKLIAARSIVATVAELAMFQIITGAFITLIGSLTKKILGLEEKDEDFEKRIENTEKNARTRILSDLTSPFPLFNPIIAEYIAKPLLDKAQNLIKLPISIYGGDNDKSLFKTFGIFGIPFARIQKTIELGRLISTGKYKDEYDKEHEISNHNRKALKPFLPFSILSSLGVLPQEGNAMAMLAMRYVKKNPGSDEEHAITEAKKKEKEYKITIKIDALSILEKETKNTEELEIINSMIKDLEATSEKDKKEIKIRNDEEKELKEYLLTDTNRGVKYDNESDLKKHNIKLYNRNFGKQSEWYQDHKIRKNILKKMRKKIDRIKEINYNEYAS